ncbi:hypothetical protein BLOT_003019 [Blomia tropicalis]|nr:hypothetical protein BLOT_003019 [Blomia tropicalis]
MGKHDNLLQKKQQQKGIHYLKQMDTKCARQQNRSGTIETNAETKKHLALWLTILSNEINIAILLVDLAKQNLANNCPSNISIEGGIRLIIDQWIHRR